MRLPQELIDHIIDYLHSDPASLRGCSRVCHAWQPTSRYHLFSKVSLKATSPQQEPSILQDRCKRLHDLLVCTPSLISNIRELEICEGSPLHHPYPDAQSSTTWVTTERTLVALFRMLTHVRRFDFSATSSLYWTLLPPTFQAALYALLSLPTMTYVRLHSWVFPNFEALDSLLRHCRSLKGLALSLTTVCTDGADSDAPDLTHPRDVPQSEEEEEEGEVGSPPEDGDRPRSSTCHHPPSLALDVLTLDFVTFAYLEYWLLGRQALVNVRSLRELRVAHFHDVLIVDNLLSAIGGSLEHLHLKPGMWNVYNFKLSRNPSLLSVRLTLENPDTAMSWALTLLSNLSPTANSALHWIGLEFYSDPKRIPIKGFCELDSLLVQSGLRSLKQVEIGLFAKPTCVEFVRVEEEMRGLRERGQVRCYRLGIKSQRSSRQLTPRISRYEGS